MAETYSKKEREKKKIQRKKEKISKREYRKENPTNEGWESMIAYVDENGIIRDTPPDPKEKTEIKAKNIEIGIPKRDREEIDPIITGTMNYFDESKGYGFIKTPEGESFFVHQNNITGQPGIGKKVRFEKEKSTKGWTAVRAVIE